MSRAWLAQLSSFLLKAGVENIVISPGSRNAPLVLHLTQSSKLHFHSLVDERSAAFYALGMAQYSRKPVVHVCTSGTAVLNMGPAVAEANYQRIPLVIFSADRPAEWIDQADGQTLRQENVFANFSKAAFNIRTEVHDEEDEWYLWRMLSEAFIAAMHPVPGPVQVNFPFSEPLYEIEPAHKKTFKHIEYYGTSSVLEVEEWDKLKQIAINKNVLITIGNHSPDPELTQALKVLKETPSIVILADLTSSLPAESYTAGASDDLFLRLDALSYPDYIPGLLISVGGPLLSKQLKTFFRKNLHGEHWHIDPAGHVTDTFQKLTKVIRCKPQDLFRKLAVELPAAGNYRDRWLKLNDGKNERVSAFIRETEFCDLKAMAAIADVLQGDITVHLGNSMPVRYAQYVAWHEGIRIYSNRGVSGIDGCISTAAGSAAVSGKPTWVIVGDLATLYDSNAFWNEHLPSLLRVVVLNNQGGNVFRIIDGPGNHPGQLKYFETPHQQRLSDLARMYHLDYFEARSEKQLLSAIDSISSGVRASILEIHTNPETNAKVMRSFFHQIVQ